MQETGWAAHLDFLPHCGDTGAPVWQFAGSFTLDTDNINRQNQRMINRVPLACLAAVVAVAPLNLPARQPDLSIQVMATFDYPGANNLTDPAEINDNGDIAGSYIDSDGLQRGFVRFSNGEFSQPIIPPFDLGHYTGATDLDDARTVCGFFSSPDDTIFHGYFLSDKIFTQFDIAGAVSTFVAALNDGGDFVGSFDTTPETTQAFVDFGGEIVAFTIPGASFTDASSINR